MSLVVRGSLYEMRNKMLSNNKKPKVSNATMQV